MRVPRGRLNRRDIFLGVLTVAFMVGILVYSLAGDHSGQELEVRSCVGRGIDYARRQPDWPTLDGRPAEAAIRERCQANPGAF